MKGRDDDWDTAWVDKWDTKWVIRDRANGAPYVSHCVPYVQPHMMPVVACYGCL